MREPRCVLTATAPIGQKASLVCPGERGWRHSAKWRENRYISRSRAWLRDFAMSSREVHLRSLLRISEVSQEPWSFPSTVKWDSAMSSREVHLWSLRRTSEVSKEPWSSPSIAKWDLVMPLFVKSEVCEEWGQWTCEVCKERSCNQIRVPGKVKFKWSQVQSPKLVTPNLVSFLSFPPPSS